MAGTGDAHLRGADEALLRVENLVVEFKSGRGQTVHAVTDVSIDVLEGARARGAWQAWRTYWIARSRLP